MPRSLLVLSLILVILEARCQTSEIEVAFRPALTSLRGNDLLDTLHRADLRFSACLGVNFFVRENSMIGVSILYEQKGSKGESTVRLRDANNQVTEIMTVYHRTEYEYITVPIVWRKRFGNSVKFQFSAGVYTSYLLNSTIATRSGGYSQESDEESRTKDFDFGLTASADLYVPVIKKISARIGLEDHLGMFNVSSVPVLNDGAIRHNSLGLVMGLNYQL